MHLPIKATTEWIKMDELKKLLENAGVEQLKEGMEFDSAGDMVSHIFGELQAIVRDHRGPEGHGIDKYSTIDDVIYEIEDLIELIDNSYVA